MKGAIVPISFFTSRFVIIELILKLDTNNGFFFFFLATTLLLAGSTGIKFIAECEETKVFSSNAQG